MKTVTRVTLSPRMARLLRDAKIQDRMDDVFGMTSLGTVVALISRGLVAAGPENPLTEKGRRMAEMICQDPNLVSWAAYQTGSRSLHIPAPKEN